MSKRIVRTYTEEFKESSIKLALDSDQPISQIAKELGMHETTLYGWIAKKQNKSQKGVLKKDEDFEELQRLRKENHRLKQERDILKKAAAYFASTMQ